MLRIIGKSFKENIGWKKILGQLLSCEICLFLFIDIIQIGLCMSEGNFFVQKYFNEINKNIIVIKVKG